MQNDNNILKRLRKEIFLAACCGGIGHLASAYSCLEIIYSLYLKEIMKYDYSNPDWDERDYFVLSKGHGSLALYAVLSEVGFFPKSELKKFSKPGGILGGEPNVLEIPGVEASTGSLGHGLSIGVGMALAIKSDKKANHVYVLVGDGECQEGSIWESIISAHAFHLDNLTMIVDCNDIQKMDFIENIIGSNELTDKITSFGWQVKRINGHKIDELEKSVKGNWEVGKPRCIIASTTKGKGLSIMENNPAWHWRMPNKKELSVFKDELFITQEEIDECKKLI